MNIYVWSDQTTAVRVLLTGRAGTNRSVERGSGPVYREGFNVPRSGRSLTQRFRPAGACSLRRMVGLTFGVITDSVQFSLARRSFDDDQADPSENEQRCEQKAQRN